MSEPRDILDLVFEREHLNIVVIGPGYGEAVVVGLPGAGWLVIDGAGRSSGRDYPVHQLLEHHIGSDVIEAMLLTHVDAEKVAAMTDESVRTGLADGFVLIGDSSQDRFPGFSYHAYTTAKKRFYCLDMGGLTESRGKSRSSRSRPRSD